MEDATLFDRSLIAVQGQGRFSRAEWRDLRACVAEAGRVPGDCVEFGTFWGQSAWLTASVLEGKDLWLYDTFDHFPDEHMDVDRKWSGTHAVDFDAVRELFEPFPFVRLVRGDFTETARREGPETVALALVDCDSYRGTAFAARWAWRRLAPGGVMFFQDYGKDHCRGAILAVDGFLGETPGAVAEVAPSGCLVVRKPTVRFLVTAWGTYLWLLEPFLASWRRHWDPLPPASYAGERVEGLEGAEFIDAFPKPGWHPSRYSGSLRDTLRAIEEPVVFLCPVDTFPLGGVDAAKVAAMARYVMARERVLRLQFHVHLHNGSFQTYREPVERWEGIGIWRCSDMKQCSLVAGMSMDAALWDRELLIDMLEPGKMFWQVETDGTRKVLHDKVLSSVVAWPPLCEAVDLIQNRTPRVIRSLNLLDGEDQEAVGRAILGGYTVIGGVN